MKTKTTPANEVYRQRLIRWQGRRTQAEAAAALGKSKRSYENWVQGQRKVPVDLILMLEREYASILPEPKMHEEAETGERLLQRCVPQGCGG